MPNYRTTPQGLSASIAPWANLTAVAVVICLFVWLVTSAFPAMLERYEAATARQRSEFSAILQAERETRTRNAESGHKAAAELTTALRELAGEVRRVTDTH